MMQKFIYLAAFVVTLYGCTPATKKDAVDPDYYGAHPEIQKRAGISEHVVEIRQMKFQPEELNVRRGDRVRWVNLDIVDHDVTELPDKTWTSSRLHAGASWSIIPSVTVDYYCSLHQVMRGKIIVSE